MGQASTRDTVDQYIEMLIRRRWSVIIPSVLIGALTVPVVMLIPATYKSSTLITVEAQKVPEAFVRSTVTIPIEERLQAISQQILSRTRLERVIEKYGLYRETESGPLVGLLQRLGLSEQAQPPVAPSSPRMQAVVERMRRNIDIQVPRGRNRDSTISISFSGDSPQMVRDVTNELASLFIEENLKVREAQAEGTTEFLENELQQMKAQLESHERQLRAFKERSMGELPDQLETNLRTLDRLQLERQVLQQSLKNAEDRYADLSRQLAVARAGTSGPSTPSELATRLQTLQARLAELRTEYRDEYPDIVMLKKEIASVEQALAAQSSGQARELPLEPTPADLQTATPLALQVADQQREINAIRQRQQGVLDQIRDYERRVENTPHREQELTMILRDYENVQRVYQSLLEKRQEARIAESLERRQKAEIFRILDPAILPQRPYQPNRPLLIMLGIAGGIVAGLGLAFAREQLDPSIKSEEDLVAATTGLPLLAVVPLMPGGKTNAAKRKAASRTTVGTST